MSAAFQRAYLSAVANAHILPSGNGDRDTFLRAFVVDKALYEVGYELNNRPEWVHIPLIGLLRLIAEPPRTSLEHGVPPPLHA